MAFKEAMRMAPPVPSLPRRAMRDFEFKGFQIPAGTGVNINPLYTHFMPEIWPEPDRYDPLRFELEASRGRHKFAYVPFGGGAHMCLGLNFAYMQANVSLGTSSTICVSLSLQTIGLSGACGQFRTHATVYR
jgi:cytochrome P450